MGTDLLFVAVVLLDPALAAAVDVLLHLHLGANLLALLRVDGAVTEEDLRCFENLKLDWICNFVKVGERSSFVASGHVNLPIWLKGGGWHLQKSF